MSVDGPAEIHDHYRFFHNKEGSFPRVTKGVENLRKAGAEFNILFLLTDKNIREPEKIYAFIKEKNYRYIQFIPSYEYDRNGKELSFSVHGEEIAKFYERIFSLWYPEDVPRVSIRLFEDVLQYLIYKRKTSCIFMDSCDSYLVVEHNGDVYPCDFYVKKDWLIGNILSQSIEELVQSSRRKEFAQRKSILSDDCQSCRIRDFCRGECPRYRPYKKGKTRKSVFCEGIQKVYSLMEKNLEGIKKSAGIA